MDLLALHLQVSQVTPTEEDYMRVKRIFAITSNDVRSLFLGLFYAPALALSRTGLLCTLAQLEGHICSCYSLSCPRPSTRRKFFNYRDDP